MPASFRAGQAGRAREELRGEVVRGLVAQLGLHVCRT